MGAGFSPGDPYYDEPYFYLSLYPRPEDIRLPRPCTRRDIGTCRISWRR